MYNEKSKVSEMINNGVNGYILKNTGKKELLEAIEKIWNGGLFFSDEIIETLMKNNSAEERHPDTVDLTRRELEIIKLIGAENTNGQIAEKLFISERTVENPSKISLRKQARKALWDSDQLRLRPGPDRTKIKVTRPLSHCLSFVSNQP